jgi:hypothetical protein
MCSESELGKLLTIAIRASQLEAGVSWDILENTKTLHHMMDSWISALMAFMDLRDIKLKAQAPLPTSTIEHWGGRTGRPIQGTQLARTQQKPAVAIPV